MKHGANIQKLLQTLLIFKENLRKTIKISGMFYKLKVQKNNVHRNMHAEYVDRNAKGTGE